MMLLYSHARKLLLFLTLSGADFVLTWHLLDNSGGPIREANPLANWLLSHGGWGALGAFKAVTVLVVLGAAFAVEQRGCQPRRLPIRGGWILGLACIVLSFVVGWSAYLSGAVATRTAGVIDPQLIELLQQQDRIAHQIDQAAAYRTQMLRLSRELVRDEVRLEDAVSQLAGMECVSDPAWQATLLDHLAMPTLHQALAVQLGRHALMAMRTTTPEREHQVAERLSLAFHEAFPSPVIERTGLELFEPQPIAPAEPHVNKNCTKTGRRPHY